MKDTSLIHQGYEAFTFGSGPKLPGAGKVYNSLYAPAYPDMTTFISSSMALGYNIIGNALGNNVLDVWITNNPSMVQTKTYNALKVLATKGTGTGDIYLVVVNRDANNSVSTNVNFRGLTITGNTTVRVLNAADFTSRNTSAHPADVSISSSLQGLGIGGSSFSYTFPAHSATSFKLNGTAASQYVQIINDNFTGQSVGAVPSNYTITPAGTVTVQNDPADANNRVIKLVRSGTDVSASRAISSISGKVRIASRIRAPQTTSNLKISVMSGTSVVGYLTFNSSGKVVDANGTTRGVYSSATWYNAELLLDTSSQTYEIYFNGFMDD